MNNERLKKFWKWFKILAIVYVGGGIALYFLQDYILFHPVSLNRNHKYDFPEKHNDINIQVSKESNLNIVQFLVQIQLQKVLCFIFMAIKKI